MQAINLLTHLILDLLRWTALAGRPPPSHLVCSDTPHVNPASPKVSTGEQIWCSKRESNSQPDPYKGTALPIVLLELNTIQKVFIITFSQLNYQVKRPEPDSNRQLFISSERY